MEIIPFISSHQNLSDLRDLFLSSLGPRGRLKILVSTAEQVRVSSTSDRIAAAMSCDLVKDPCSEAIMHLVKGHLATWGDFGLTIGALTCDFVQIFSETNSKTTSNNALKTFHKTIDKVLEDNLVKIDVGNLNQMLSVIKTILDSKPLVNSGRTSREDKTVFINKTSAKILEGFLQTISVSGDIEFDLCLNVEIGNKVDDVQLCQGFLFPVPDMPPEVEWKCKQSEKMRVIALNIQLKDDCSELSELMENVTFENTYSGHNVEKEFLKRRLVKLADFCVKNKGKKQLDF